MALLYVVVLKHMLTSNQSAVGRNARWARVRAHERTAHARLMWECKRVLHLHRVLSLSGHFKFMALCATYARKWKCALTPADRAWIRAKHAEEIAASGRPLDESKRLAKLSPSARKLAIEAMQRLAQDSQSGANR